MMSEDSVSLDREVACIFRHVEQFARVERFHLEAFGTSGGRPSVTSSWFDMQDDTITLTVPLIMLPSVKKVSLYSNVQLKIFAIGDESLVPLRFFFFFFFFCGAFM